MVGWTVPLALVLLPIGIVGVTAFVSNHAVRGFRPQGEMGGAWFPRVDDRTGKLHRVILTPRDRTRRESLTKYLYEAVEERKRNGNSFLPLLLVRDNN